MAVTLDKLTYREHTEKELRHALGRLMAPWPFDKQPDEADVVLDGIVEALTLRKTAKRCPHCTKETKQ